MKSQGTFPPSAVLSCHSRIPHFRGILLAAVSHFSVAFSTRFSLFLSQRNSIFYKFSGLGAELQPGAKQTAAVRRPRLGQRSAQPLRMPLDGPDGKRPVKQGLYRAVRGPLDGLEIVSQMVNRLVMGAVGDACLSPQLPQRGGSRPHLVQPVRSGCIPDRAL